MKLKETIIKALSLGTGLAIGLILIAKVCYEMSYDTCYTDYDQIYQIRTVYTQHGEDMDFPQISGAIAPGFKEYVPGVEVATRWTFLVNSDKFIDEQNNVITGECIAADIVIIVLVAASIVLNSLRISRSNPVESLKSE